MHEVLQELGLPRQLSKDKPVSPEGKYLGWWLDSQLQKMRLPDDKRDAITAHINRMLIPKERKDGSVQPISEMGFFLKNDLESLIGKLTHGNLVFSRESTVHQFPSRCEPQTGQGFQAG